MNLDNRLKRITDFIPSDSYILDVGCDHALLDIYLALNRNNVKLIASDINENPLKIAKENIKKYNLEDEITLEKADGVSKINDEVDTVVIAGMGTSTINDIINNAKTMFRVAKAMSSSDSVKTNNDTTISKNETVKEEKENISSNNNGPTFFA